MTIADQGAHTQPHPRLHEEADARGIDDSMLAAMMDEYRRVYGAEPGTLSELICGVTC